MLMPNICWLICFITENLFTEKMLISLTKMPHIGIVRPLTKIMPMLNIVLV